MKIRRNDRLGLAIGRYFTLLMLLSPVITYSQQRKNNGNTTDTATFTAHKRYCMNSVCLDFEPDQQKHL